MRTFLNELTTQMRAIWARLEGPQRLVVSAVMLATIVGLGAIVWFAGRPSYETIVTVRTAADVARVQAALQSAGVSWVNDNTGFGFMVERSQVTLARNAIASDGVLGPQTPDIGGTGSLIEDAATKAWRLDAASRAEAAAAIQRLDGVVSVTVTASRPRRTVAFRDSQKEQKASASVLLRLSPGATFETIADSAASIAASTLMVPKENIDVVNAVGGRRWNYNPDRNSGAGSNEFLALQRRMSDERTQLAQERLDQMWPGKIAVQVNIELDPSWEVRSEKVLPDEAIVRSEDVTKDTTDTPGQGENATAAKSKNEVRNVQYVTEIGERRTGKMMQDIKRMTVAVMYDTELAAQINAEDLKKTVKAIVGWDPARDDEEGFSTMTGTFAPLEIPELVSEGPSMGDTIARWAPTIGQILGVLVVVMFLRGLFKRSSRAPTAAAAAATGPVEVPEDQLAPEELQRRMRREIERSIAQDPAALAKMLEAWLMEQKA
ncbi:MAG: flagellar M-ring protein FliF C-terminal domain-containing protein [Planctomycetota bacterium]